MIECERLHKKTLSGIEHYKPMGYFEITIVSIQCFSSAYKLNVDQMVARKMTVASKLRQDKKRVVSMLRACAS
jgi:hypothetical protein